MTKNVSNNKKKSSMNDINGKPVVGNGWDPLLGDWQEIRNRTDPKLCIYSVLLSEEKTVFILRQFKLYNRDVEGNRYLVKNYMGYNLFYGIENNRFTDKLCICGQKRAFDMRFLDKNKETAFILNRPFRPLSCCGIFSCCRQKIEVKDFKNKTIGEVKELLSFFHLSLKLVLNGTEFKIKGPNCGLNLSYCLDDICFDIRDDKKNSLGHICKFSELTSGGHIFQLVFNKPMSPELKCLVIGASILIDYYYYENSYHENKYHNMTTPSASEALPPFPLAIRHNHIHESPKQSIN